VGVVRRATAGRWAVALGGTVAIGLLPTAVAALPVTESSQTLDQLVTAARNSAAVGHEGYAETTGNLGLPDLPRLGAVAALLGGTSHARVWWRSSDTWRVDRVTATGESDTYNWHGTVHTWDFEARRVATVLTASPVRLPRMDDLLPPQAARRILAGLSSADAVTRLPAKRVAGRSADGVRITPASTHTTVGHVDMYVDPATGLPLSVQLFSRGSANPALTSRFLDVRMTRPSDAALKPRAPIGVPHDTIVVADIATAADVFAPFALPQQLAGFPRSRDLAGVGTGTYGEGLARFTVVPLNPDLGQSALRAAIDGGGVELTISGGSAALLETPLLNAVIAHGDPERGPPIDNRGRSYLIAGTVDSDTLTAAITALFDNPPASR
jgi:hypothetical protein